MPVVSAPARATERHDPAPLSSASAAWLCAYARVCLAEAMGLAPPPISEAPDDPRLDEPGPLFVSWHLRGALVGCIGSLGPYDSLREGVKRYAVMAGTQDRRTPDLASSDFDALNVEISLLGERRLLSDAHNRPARSRQEIASLLEVGKDGLILSQGETLRAFFLPVVWAQLPKALDFVDALSRKAGIPVSDRERMRAEILGVHAFGDPPA